VEAFITPGDIDGKVILLLGVFSSRLFLMTPAELTLLTSP